MDKRETKKTKALAESGSVKSLEKEPLFERPEESPRQSTEATEPKSQSAFPAPSSAPAISSTGKPQLIKEIEEILEEDMADLYGELAPAEKMIFKRKGEETASKIRLLLAETKTRAREIVKLIISWLKIIPGISKVFIDQEAKIKTDKLLRFKK